VKSLVTLANSPAPLRLQCEAGRSPHLEFAEVRSWIFSDEDNGAFSFKAVCDALALWSTLAARAETDTPPTTRLDTNATVINRFHLALPAKENFGQSYDSYCPQQCRREKGDRPGSYSEKARSVEREEAFRRAAADDSALGGAGRQAHFAMTAGRFRKCQ